MSQCVARQTRLFQLSAASAFLFFLFTAAAMIVYPGGTPDDPGRKHYAFFVNVFSDLGRTRTFSGRPNLPSMLLFVCGTMLGAIAMMSFFIGFAWVLNDCRPSLHLSRTGAIFGVMAAVCFVGVAATPWDLYLGPHMEFVMWAFRCFLLAVVLNLAAGLFKPGFPRRFAVVFAMFALMLVGYIILLTTGFDADTPVGTVQSIGQKLIVYSAMLTVMVQSLGMRRHLAMIAPSSTIALLE